MTDEQIERLHDQARNTLGFCVQARDVSWCDAHGSLKYHREEACRAMNLAYAVAESAGEVMEEMVHADLRAKVEALRDESWLTNESAYNALTQALALIDGGNDGQE